MLNINICFQSLSAASFKKGDRVIVREYGEWFLGRVNLARRNGDIHVLLDNEDEIIKIKTSPLIKHVEDSTKVRKSALPLDKAKKLIAEYLGEAVISKKVVAEKDIKKKPFIKPTTNTKLIKKSKSKKKVEELSTDTNVSIKKPSYVTVTLDDTGKYIFNDTDELKPKLTKTPAWVKTKSEPIPPQEKSVWGYTRNGYFDMSNVVKKTLKDAGFKLVVPSMYSHKDGIYGKTGYSMDKTIKLLQSLKWLYFEDRMVNGRLTFKIPMDNHYEEIYAVDAGVVYPNGTVKLLYYGSELR